MMNSNDVTAMISRIWPTAVAKDWIPAPVLTKLCSDIARLKLDASQVEAAMLEHCTRDHGANNKPVTAKLMARLGAMNADAVNKQTGEVKEPGRDDFIFSLRKSQSASNPSAWHQPAWKIVAANYEAEYTNFSISHTEKMNAAKWVANSLRTYGAAFNDSIYAAATIYNVDPVELQELTDRDTLKALNSQAINRKAIARIAADAERFKDAERARMPESKIVAGAA